MQNDPMFVPGFSWKQSKSIVALVTLVAFTVTTLVWDPMAFAGAGVPVAGEVSAFAQGVLQIPVELGQVTETLMGDPKAPAFIHIQSAHGNYSAEKNIEKLLGFIEKNSSVKLMLLEGATGKLHPEMFRIFPKHPDFNKKVTDKLVREGYLTGPESFLIGSDDKTEGWGIEDLDAYKKDREAFIHVVEKEKVAEKFLGSLRATIDRRFSSKLNKDLLNLVRQEEAFGSGTVSFEGWLTVLKAASQKHLTLDLSDAFYQDQYPFLIRYFRLQAIGSKIDREKARHEADAFLKELASRKVSEEVLENFKAILQTSETELLRTVSRTTDGYSTLRRAFDLAFSSLPKDFSMTQWPNWTLYAQYIILMQEMEGKGLHEETLKLKDKIQTALAKTADEKAYLSQARELYLLRRLFNLELTRPEYEELAQTVKTSDTQEIQTLYKTAMDFYSTAVERENKMFQNALTKMAGTKQQHAVIVTGGFHAEGLKELAKEKNASYLQITPRIAEVSKRDHEVYLRSILGSRDVETSQMSALLGIVDRAQRVAVTGVAATKDWARDVRSLVLGLINSENVSARQALSVSFSNSIFGSQTPALVPVIARAEVREKQAATKVVAVDSQINSIAQKLTLAAALAFTSVSAHADSVGVLSSFSSEQSVSVWFWGSVLSLGALFAGYFIVWRLFFPINWHLRRLLSNEYAVRSRAIEKLVSIGSKAVPALIRILEDKTNISSSNVIEILERIKDARSIPGLIVGLGDKSEEIRFRSARALAEFADARIVPTLRKTADGWLQDLRKQRGELEETLKQTPSTIEQEETRQEELVELGGRGDRGGVYTIGYEIVPTGRMETVSNSAYTDLSWRISRLEVVEREIASFLLRAEEVNHVRSETRLTPAQEKQFQKALRDLQPKWWDGLLGEIDGNERKKRALKTLGELKDSRSFRVLKEKILLHQEEPNFPSQQAVKSMKEFPTDMLLSGLMPFLGSEDERVGQNMVSIFEGLEDPAIVLPMIQALEGRDPRARERAASVLLGSRDFRSLDAFLRVLKNLNESAEMRRTAISAIRNWNPSDLGKERTTQWVEALISCLDNPPTRDDAARTLGDLKDRRAIKPLVDRLMTIDPSMLPPVFLFALRDLQWEPKNVNEAIRFACGLRSDATIWDKVALFGPAAVPLLMDLLISKDFELRRNVATVLLKIADPKLAGLDRYLEWTQDGTPPEQRKLIFLTPEKIETIKRAFAEGRTIQVEYEEQEMVSHQESYLDTYGQDYFYVVVDTPGYLSVKITGMGQEIGSVSVARTVGPAVTASPNGFPEPYAKDVGFWEFRLPVFNAASEGLSVTRLRDALEVLKNRGWLWSHFESTHRERVNQRATDRLEQLLSKVHAVMITLYANGILSAATPLVSLQLAGSYLWTDSPNDLDLVVIVEGERNFEKMSASNHTNGFLPVIPGIETSYEVVGLETLRRAVGGDEVKDANVIRRKAIMYSVSVPLAGIDLFASQSIPFDSYVTMRNDLMTDASRAAWRDLKGDPAKIAAKRLWRQEESDAMEKWLAMQRRLISEGSTEELRKMHERLSQIDSLILAAEANLEEEKSKLARLRQQDVSFDAGASRSEASQKQTLRSEVRTQLGAEDYAAANGVFSYLAEQSQDIPMNPDVLIVLGNPDHEVNGTAAAALYHRLNPKWVLVAGKGKKDRPEAHEFRDVLVARGVPGDKIFIEDQSMNTGQNAQFGSKLLREAMENRDPDMLNRPITAVVTQKPMGQRLSTDIMEKQFAWPQGISFFPSAPRVPQVNGQTDNEEFFQLVAEALDQIRRFPDFARQKFIDPKAAQHPNEVTQAVGRLTALMQSRSETRLTLHQADDSGEQEKQFQKALRNFQLFSWKKVVPIVFYVGIHVGGFLLVLSFIVSYFDLDLKSLQDRYWLVLMGSPSFLMTVMFLRSLPGLLRQIPSVNDHIAGRQAEGKIGAKSRSEVRWTDSEEKQSKEVLAGHQEGLSRGKFVMELLLAGMIGMTSLVSRAVETPQMIEKSTEIRAKGSVGAQSFSSQRVDQETLQAHVADIPSLLGSLYDEDSRVREQALTALRKIKTEPVVTGLLKSLDDKTGLNVAARERVIQTLSEMEVLEAVPVFIRLATDPTELRSIRDIAYLAIYSVRNPAAAPQLVNALASDDLVFRFFVLKALSEMPAVSVTEALKEGLHNPDPRIAEGSFEAIVKRGKIYEVNDPALVPFLKKMMAHGEFSYGHFAADALYRISKIQYYQAAYGSILKEIIKIWAGIFALILTPLGVARVLKKIQLHHYRKHNFYASRIAPRADYGSLVSANRTVDPSVKYHAKGRSESRKQEEIIATELSYKGTLNALDAVRGVTPVDLDFGVLKGFVLMPGARLEGKVRIISDYEGVFDLSTSDELALDAYRNAQGRLELADVVVTISQKGQVSVQPSFQSVKIERNPLKHVVIAIDGSSASGKGTVSRKLAEKLGYLHIDLGTFNRAIAEKALREGVDLDDLKVVQNLLKRTTLEARFVNAQTQLLRDGLPVTDSIRSFETGNAAAVISRHSAVLQWIFQQARRIGEEHDVVMEGRNIGTDIFPDAQWKFYVTADVEVRAARRLSDFQKAGDVNISLQKVQDDLRNRDRRDRMRPVAPFRKALDAFEIDNSYRPADETVGILMNLMADPSARSEIRLTPHQADDSGELKKRFSKVFREFQLFSWKRVLPIVLYVGIHVGGFLLVLSFIVSYFDMNLKSLQDRYWLVLMGSPSFLMTVMYLRSLPDLLKQIPSVNDHITGRQAEGKIGAKSRSESRIFARVPSLSSNDVASRSEVRQNGEVNKPGESKRAFTKNLAIFAAAFTALSAHAAEEMPGVLGFRADHPLDFAILLGAAGIICVIPIFFIAWRLIFPLSWFIWRAGSEESDVRNNSKGKLLKIVHSAAQALINALSTTSVDRQIAIIEALGEIKDDRAVEPLLELLQHGKTSDVRGVSATALRQMRNLKVVPALVKALQDDDHVCSLAVAALEQMGEVKALPAIIRESKNPARQVVAQDALVSALKAFKAIDALADLVSDPRDNICFRAAAALGEIGDKTLLPLFISELQNEKRSSSVYSALISGIDRWKDQSVIPALLGRLDERSGKDNRRAVASMLWKLCYFTPGAQLAGLRRYFEWIEKTPWNTYSILSNDEVAGIQAAYLRGEALVADYREDPEETDVEVSYDSYGNYAGYSIEMAKYPHLNISNIRSRTAAGVETPVMKRPKPVPVEIRSEVRLNERIDAPQVSEDGGSSLGAKIGTAWKVAANTVSPLLSSAPVYASEIAPQLFSGTEHYQKVPALSEEFVAKWPVFNKIMSRSATAATERMVIDQRQGVPDAASVLPLVEFARYNPKTVVVLALVDASGQTGDFERVLAALTKTGVLPSNFKVQTFGTEAAFVLEFNEFYNSSVPFGRPVALVTDTGDSIVTSKIGARRQLLSVVGDRNPLKQTASVLLAADKLLDDSVWSMSYHFVPVEKLGGLEALMAELTGFVAAQAKLSASA